MNRKLTDIELSMVCEVIASRMGLHFPVERWAMLRRNLVPAAREFGFQNIGGFIQWLLSATLNKEQMEILAAHLTISETYFWREPQVFTALTDFILPELIKSKKKGERSIRIWSAGCSTGEEPYSIAIALHKTIPKIKDWNITILATDINPKALDKAEHGIYSTWSFRNSPAWLKSSYFHHKEDLQYEIIPEIRKMVTFTCLSLVEMSAISSTNTMDIIFCRNVLMYFTKEWVNKISQNLFHTLSEDGWFVVSSSELSSQVFPQFTPVNFPGAVLYRKGKDGSTHSYNIPSDEILEPLSDTALLTTEASTKMVVKAVAKVVAKVAAKEYPQSIVKTPEESYTDKIFSIRLLANQGHLEEALSICNEAIASYKLSSGLYFLRASILQELDKSSEAIASLKQAIYIDPEYIMGHFTLGNLFIRQGNAKNAKRYFDNVLDLSGRCANDDILPESEGLSVKYIREIIFANMQTQLTK
ncbi:MAG: CheR family methyltransferase [Bacteroidales bacterium]|jgi:chemotaxis protein methyltransferase CheR